MQVVQSVGANVRTQQRQQQQHAERRRRSGRAVCAAAAAVAGLVGFTGRLSAASITWVGGGVDDSWSTAANWLPAAPVANDALIFAGTTRLTPTNDSADGTAYTGITFNAAAGAFTLNGNRLLLAGDVVNNSTNLQTINNALDFNATRTLNAATGPLLLTGLISNTSTAVTSINFSGTGTITNNFNASSSGSTIFGSAATANNANWTFVDNATNTAQTLPRASFNLLAGAAVTFGTATSAPNLTFAGGSGTDNTIGNTVGTSAFNMVNGVLNLQVRLNTVTGNVSQSGGAIHVWNQIQLSNGALTNASNFTLSGGTFDVMNSTGTTEGGGNFFVASRGVSTLTISGGTLECNTMDVSRNITNGTKGLVNLNGGTLLLSSISTSTANSVATNTLSSGTFNFNGGTLKARGANANFIRENGQANPNNTPLNVMVKAGGAIIDSNGFDITATLPLQHDTSAPTDGGLTKNSAGNLTLAGNNTYNGATTINAGTLTLGGGGTTGALASASVVDNAVLAFNRTDAATHAFVISGTGGVSQNGTGVSILSATNTYSGDTNVNTGGLAVTGSLPAAGHVNVNTGGALGGTGTVGIVQVNTGGSLRPGASTADGSAGVLHTGALTIADGTELRLDLVGPGTSDRISVNGAATFGGATTVNLVTAGPAGQYTLLDATSPITYAAAAPTLNAPSGTRLTFGLDNTTDPSKLLLNVTGSTKNLTWTGTAGNTWDLNNTVNWSDAGGPAANETYFNLDNVTFNDTAANRTVALDQTITPASVTVNNSVGNDYTISGGGAISGSTGLTKSGAGRLVLGTNNTYTGTTAIQNGTVALGSASAIPAASSVVLGSGANSGVLDINGQSPTLGAISTSGTGTGNVITNNGNDSTLTISATSTFGGRIVDGGGATTRIYLNVSAGTLTLTDANNYTNGTTIAAGAAIQLGNGGATGSIPLTNMTNNGTLVFNRTGTVVVEPNMGGSGATRNLVGTLQLGNNNGAGGLAGGPIFNSGTLVFARTDSFNVASPISGTGALRKQSTGNLTLSGANGYTGNTIVEAGKISPATSGAFGTIPGGSVSIQNGAAIDLSANATVNNLNFGLKPFYIEGSGPDGNGAIVNNNVGQQNAFQVVRLTNDAVVGGSQRIDVRGATTTALTATLDLAGHTLTSNNSLQFVIVGADVSDGNLVANSGIFGLEAATQVKDFGTGKTITYNTTGGGLTVASLFGNTGIITRPMIFNPGTGSIQFGNNSNTAATVGSNITLNGDIAMSPRNANGTGQVTLTGVIGGVGGINKTADNAGNNTVVFTGNNTYSGTTTISAGTIALGGGTTSGSLGSGAVTNNANLAFNRTNTLTVANTISGTGQLFQRGTGTTVLSGVNTYTGATNVTAGHLVIGSGDAIGSGASLLNVGTAGFAHVGASLPKAVKVNGLTNAGTVDMNNGKLVIDYAAGNSPVATVRSQLATGFAGGSWNGAGINTSAPVTVSGHAMGVGFAEANAVGAASTTWNGQPVDGDAVLVRYTLAGDGNVDGTVNLTDFTFLAANFNKPTGAQWLEGDYNYDGKVDLSDFTFLASNFNQSVAAPDGAAGLGSLVPEPGSLTVLGVGAAAVLGRRRRRAR